MMLESDNGLFRPVSFGFTGNDAGARNRRGDRVAAATASAPIASLRAAAARTSNRASQAAGFRACRSTAPATTSSFHHTQADTVDKIDPADVSRAAAAIAVMTYVIADLPVRLGEIGQLVRWHSTTGHLVIWSAIVGQLYQLQPLGQSEDNDAYLAI